MFVKGSGIRRNRHEFPRRPQRISCHPRRCFLNSRLAGVFWVRESTDPQLSTDNHRVLKGRKWNKPTWLGQQYWVQILYTHIAFQILTYKSVLIGKFAGGRVEAKAAPREGQITPQTTQATTPAPNRNCQDGGWRVSLRCGWTSRPLLSKPIPCVDTGPPTILASYSATPISTLCLRPIPRKHAGHSRPHQGSARAKEIRRTSTESSSNQSTL